MDSIAEPIITLVVHRVNIQAHPTVPEGWRWAVHVGRLDASNAGQCANAGWAPERGIAFLDGETCAATAVRAVRMIGIPVQYSQLELDHDPIGLGADHINFL